MIAIYGDDGRITSLVTTYHKDTPAAYREQGIKFVEFSAKKTRTMVALLDGKNEVRPLKAAEISRRHYVDKGKLKLRPLCKTTAPAKVSPNEEIEIKKVPEGATVAVILNWGERNAVRHELPADEGGRFAVSLDEPGRLRLIVTPTWPMMESVHDVEVVEGE